MKQTTFVSVLCATVSFAVLWCLGGCTSRPRLVITPEWTAPQFKPKDHPKVVLVVEDQTGQFQRKDKTLRLVEDEFTHALLSKGYRLAARDEMDRLDRELQFQRSGFTDMDAINLGKMLNISSVVIVSLVEYRLDKDRVSYLRINDKYEYGLSVYTKLSGRIVGVETGEMLGVGTYTDRTEIGDRESASFGVTMCAKALANEFPSRRLEVMLKPEGVR